ncbi:hypothetical protein E308F_24770 [Moorella sp. E308F]|uniref:hypothetical protein n=1 Tax=unclassified Neomoorella TaxID=2676739 RepID=UPI0010FFB225|nr:MULTISPECIES: hypothetical protein [unclassified Moorella (in: firmicutes)]GEA16233.1 hypothetical protein E308F_24770 [Moorella sp. E308F]GEA18907.1 hypothetical protein E306M_20440 [Moorella sp. E306M]
MAILQERINQLQVEIADLKRCFPAHSLKHAVFHSWKSYSSNKRRNNYILTVNC